MNRLAAGLGVLAILAAGCSAQSAGAPDCSAGQCDETEDGGPGDETEAQFCKRVGGKFPKSWIKGGPDCGTEPAIQVHAYDEDTFILRQSLCTSGEGPFLYLMFGTDKVLMEDTGDDVGIPIPLVETVAQVIADWAKAHDRDPDSLELVVVNSHAHGDHVAGNGDLAAAGATVVGFTKEKMGPFFGIDNWPEGSAAFDLGGRVVDIVPIPGHEANHIAIYDRSRGLLLTGDTFYPGRLFINKFAAYKTSVAKLVAMFADKPVCHVLGTHIEMSKTPGQQFPQGSMHHPNEHVLQLSRDQLIELNDALIKMTSPENETHDDFVIFPL